MIKVEVWMYGPLAKYAPDNSQPGYAQLNLEMPEGARMRDLVERIGLPLEEKGITIVNGQLTDMPGLAADLELELQESDRVAFFHERSMWPFQYRFGADTSPELLAAMQKRGFLRHT